MLPFELTKDTPYLALSGELWSNRNWPCYKGFLLYYLILSCGLCDENKDPSAMNICIVLLLVDGLGFRAVSMWHTMSGFVMDYAVACNDPHAFGNKDIDSYFIRDESLTQRAHDAIITSLVCQNDVATSFRHDNDVIIASCFRWGHLFSEIDQQMAQKT